MWRWSSPIAANLTVTSVPLDGDAPALAGGEQDRVDEAVHAQRLAASDTRRATLVEGVQEVGDERLVPPVRERHRVGAAAAARGLAVPLAASVGKGQLERVPVEQGSPPRAGDREPLRPAGEAGRSGVEAAQRPVRE